MFTTTLSDYEFHLVRADRGCQMVIHHHMPSIVPLQTECNLISRARVYFPLKSCVKNKRNLSLVMLYCYMLYVRKNVRYSMFLIML